MMKLLNKKLFFGLASTLVISVCVSGAVFAAVPTTFSTESQNNALINVRNKVMYNIIADCYDSLSDEINVTSGYITWSKIFDNGDAKYNIPYYLFNNSTISSSKKLSCSEIMGGWKNFWGTQTFPGVGYREDDVPVPDADGNFGTKEDMVKFLGKIGYTPTKESAGEADGYRCVSYAGNTPSGKVYATDKVCAKQSNNDENRVDLNYAIKVDDVSSDDLGAGNLDTMIFKIKTVEFADGVLTIPKVGRDSWIFLTTGATHAHTDNYASCTTTYVDTPLQWSNSEGTTYALCYSYGFLGLSTGRLRVSGIKSMTFGDLARSLGTALMTAKEAEPNNFPSFSSQEVMVDNAKIDPAIATVLEKGSFEEYMEYFMGTNYAQYNEGLTETEKYMLYWSGLGNVVTAYDGAAGGNVEYWLVGTEFKEDYNLTCSSGCDVTTLDRDGKIKTLKAISGSNPTVLELLNELDYDSDDFGTVVAPEEDIYEDIVDDDGETEVDVDLCYGNSGSLGWIVCPVITWLGDTLDTIYTDMVEPFLVVNSELVDSGNNSPTHKAWDIFRNFANIAFVILFLVVIFSQLTGVGIDNYGIKKILPKLIVAAILINLSYVICQLAVDLSNILGSGLNSMFTAIAEEVPMEFNGEFNSGTWFAGLLNGLLAVLGIGGVGAIVGAAVGPGLLAGIILPLLMGLLVAFIAVIFFFALLGIRKAGVVMLVALAPMAFACYMLPNTKKLFDKWLKMFEGLLLLYPICGMLIGGSVLTSRILVSASVGDFFVYSVGLLLLVVPFFFVPVLLKGSFAAMGNIGAKISGLGSKFGRGLAGKADKGIRNSETFRRMDNAMGRRSVFKTRRAAAVAGTAALMQERSKRDRLGNRENMQTRIDAIAAAEEAKATDEQTSQRLSLMMSSGSQGGIKMNDGATRPYTLDNLTDRMTELRDNAKGRALTSAERVELSALARGMAGMKGGAGKIGKIVRGAEVTDPATGMKKVNSNFMSAFGEIYARDAAVQGKMNEKDVGASVFAEKFMPGGAGVGASPSFTSTFAAYQSGVDYQSALSKRIKSYEAGLNQGGDAVDEYISSLGARDCQAIYDDDKLFNGLDVDVRNKFIAHAGTFGVNSRSAQTVTGNVNANITGGTVDANVTNPTLNVQGTVDVGNEVDVNIRQSRGGQVQPVDVRPRIFPKK